MKSSTVLDIIERFGSLIEESFDKMNDQEQAIATRPAFDAAMIHLRELLMHKISTIDKNNDVISSKVSKQEMTLKDWIEFHRLNNFTDEETELLIARLHSLANFTFPMIELFPGDGKFTRYATAGEPLYIVDYSPELLEFASTKFNDFFSQRRLMKYVIEDYDLSNLPEAQFGVAFCFNMFFVKNLDFIFNWAMALKKVLRPGGYFMFNFVPSNTSWGLELAEDFRFTAIDHERLASMLVEAGFEIVETEIRQTLASTMLIKMPGELKTFKLTGSLARIIDKSEPFV